MASTRVAVGFSRHRNPKTAGQEAAQQALDRGGIEKPDLVLLFATAGYEQEVVLRAVREATSHAPLAGCSGEGIIASDQVDESPYAVAVMAIQSDEIRFENALAVNLDKDPFAAGHDLGAALREEVANDGKALLIFLDGITGNFAEMTRGWREATGLSPTFPMFGGLAGDAMTFERTYQYCNDQVISNGVSAVLLSGDLEVVSGIDSGCAPPVGESHQITRAEGNLIYEINGRRATDWFKEYLEEHAAAQPEKWSLTKTLAFALAFRAEDERKLIDDFYVYGISVLDEEAGTLALATAVKEGSQFWLTSRDPGRMRRGVERLGATISKELGGKKPKMVFQFDCAGRGKFMLPEDEAAALVTQLQKQVSTDVPWIGFYTYGEVGPVSEHVHNHNYTVVLAAIY